MKMAHLELRRQTTMCNLARLSLIVGLCRRKLDQQSLMLRVSRGCITPVLILLRILIQVSHHARVIHANARYTRCLGIRVWYFRCLGGRVWRKKKCSDLVTTDGVAQGLMKIWNKWENHHADFSSISPSLERRWRAKLIRNVMYEYNLFRGGNLNIVSLFETKFSSSNEMNNLTVTVKFR